MNGPLPRFPALYDDEVGHYIDPVSGVVYTGVTRLIGWWAPYTGPPMEEPARRGKFLHQVQELLAEGQDVDDQSVPEEWRGWVQGLRRFYREVRIEPIAWEIPLGDPQLAVVCLPDLVAWYEGKRTIFEFKSGRSDNVDLQLGCQRRIWNQNFPQAEVGALYCVPFTNQGGYRLDPVKNPFEAEQDFLALYRLWARAQRNGGG